MKRRREERNEEIGTEPCGKDTGISVECGAHGEKGLRWPQLIHPFLHKGAKRSTKLQAFVEGMHTARERRM